LPSRKNVGGHKPTKIANRSALAFACLSETAADLPQRETLPRPAPFVRVLCDRGRRFALLLGADNGTSVAQIDAIYGNLLPDSEDYLRGLLDSYDERTDAETEAFSR
jgi:hypothetical protein